MRRVIGISTIVVAVIAATIVGLLTLTTSGSDPTSTVLTAIGKTCDTSKSRSHDLIADLDIVFADGRTHTGTVRMEVDGSNSYSRLIVDGLGSAEAIYANGEYYYREGDAPWSRQVYVGTPPETIFDVCIPAAASGIVGTSSTDIETAQIDGKEYVDNGEEGLDGVTVRHYIPGPTPTPDATAPQLPPTPVFRMDREFWVDSQGYIVQMRHETNEPGGRVVYMISLSGFGEPNVITAPVVPTPSP